MIALGDAELEHRVQEGSGGRRIAQRLAQERVRKRLPLRDEPGDGLERRHPSGFTTGPRGRRFLAALSGGEEEVLSLPVVARLEHGTDLLARAGRSDGADHQLAVRRWQIRLSEDGRPRAIRFLRSTS